MKERRTQDGTTAGWEEYTIARNNAKEIGQKKKGNMGRLSETSQGFDGGMKQVWVGMRGKLGKRAGEGRRGNSYLESTER